MSKINHRKLTQFHTANKWQSWDLNPVHFQRPCSFPWWYMISFTQRSKKVWFLSVFLFTGHGSFVWLRSCVYSTWKYMSNLCLKGLYKERKMASHILSFMCSFPHSLSNILLRDTLFQCQCQILGFPNCVQATYPLGQWVFYIFGSKTVFFFSILKILYRTPTQIR